MVLAPIVIDEIGAPVESVNWNLASSITNVNDLDVSNEFLTVAVKWASVLVPVKSP